MHSDAKRDRENSHPGQDKSSFKYREAGSVLARSSGRGVTPARSRTAPSGTMPAPGTWLVGAVLVTSAAQTLAHPQYMLSRNKCSSPLAEGTPMMKGRAWATEEPGVAIVAARQALDGTLSVLTEGAAFVAGETLQLGTAGLAQGGLAMSVSHGTFDATDASRSDALPLSIGCDSTRLSNWIGTHIENGVDLTTCDAPGQLSYRCSPYFLVSATQIGCLLLPLVCACLSFATFLRLLSSHPLRLLSSDS
eukprot:COSAG06_NODE_15886_length_1037_cov_1.513859_1_plen_249_part_00